MRPLKFRDCQCDSIKRWGLGLLLHIKVLIKTLMQFSISLPFHLLPHEDTAFPTSRGCNNKAPCWNHRVALTRQVKLLPQSSLVSLQKWHKHISVLSKDLRHWVTASQDELRAIITSITKPIESAKQGRAGGVSGKGQAAQGSSLPSIRPLPFSAIESLHLFYIKALQKVHGKVKSQDSLFWFKCFEIYAVFFS